MKLSTILVHLDHGEHCNRRVVLAAGLARQHGAHLVGLVSTGLHDGRLAPNGRLLQNPEFIAASAAFLRARAEATVHLFQHWMHGAQPVSYETRLVEGGSLDAMLRHGHSSDLLVIGQVDHGLIDHDKTAEPTARSMPAELLVHAGRPVLLVPSVGPLPEAVRDVAVAWDGTRAAAVAMRDALPLLASAESVDLVTVHGAEDWTTSGSLCLPEMQAWLQRHGVQAQAREAYGPNIADALLAHCRDRGADLLVMGGFGHTRTREVILGGSTQEIMARMKLPVLFSH